MREITITKECLDFIDSQDKRVVTVVCLCGFHKKSNKDYKKAVRQAEKILSDYLKQN